MPIRECIFDFDDKIALCATIKHAVIWLAYVAEWTSTKPYYVTDNPIPMTMGRDPSLRYATRILKSDIPQYILRTNTHAFFGDGNGDGMMINLSTRETVTFNANDPYERYDAN